MVTLAGNVNHEVASSSDVEAKLCFTSASGATGDADGPPDLDLSYEVDREQPRHVMLNGLSVDGKASEATGVGLPTFAEHSRAFLEGCCLSQIPALDALAVPMMLVIRINSLQAVRVHLAAYISCSLPGVTPCRCLSVQA